jgi:prepilin-type N-terminal cleavage/methylation domain-containing protein
MKSRFVKTNAKPRGFTLIEVMMAVMLIGLAIVSLVASSGAFTRYNAMGVDLSTAEFLIEEIRELTAPLSVVDPVSGKAVFGAETGETTLAAYDDIDDFNGQSFNPPVDAERTQMPEFVAYTQQVTVQNVTPADLTVTAANHSTDLYRVTVAITKAGRTIASASWIRAKY